MNRISITHSPAEGTLIDGTAKGDGSASILKTHRARWSRNLSRWYIPHTRDKEANQRHLNQLFHALQEAGFTVELLIEKETRSVAEVEADMAHRYAQRVEALKEELHNKKEALRAQQEREAAAVQALPPMGEPIKVGHHSESRHRAAQERAGRELDKLGQVSQQVKDIEGKLSSAEHGLGARYSRQSVFNRIQKLEAEHRKCQRIVTTASGEYKLAMSDYVAQVEKQISYWTEVLESHNAHRPRYSKETVKPGDLIKAYNSWYVVARANAKTCTVWFDEARTVTHSSRVPYELIEAHRADK